MICMKCHAERLASGSAWVLPELRRRILRKGVHPWATYLAMPSILLFTIYFALYDSRAMLIIVPTWLIAANRLGRAHHCPAGSRAPKLRRKDKGRRENDVTENPPAFGNHPEDRAVGLQRNQERQDALTVPQPDPFQKEAAS